jgi:hypothetical protein
MDLVVKKMKSTNNMFSKLEQMLEKVRVMGYPEGVDPNNMNYRAILRIRIPSAQPVPEEEEQENSESDEDKPREVVKKEAPKL